MSFRARETQIQPIKGNFMKIILETQNLTKNFGVFNAVSNVSFKIEKGKITKLSNELVPSLSV